MSLRKTLEYTGVNASTYNITLTFTGSDTDKYRIVAVNGVDIAPVLCSAGPYMMSWAHAANPGTITFEPVEDVAGGTATYNMTATATFDDDGDSLIAATAAVHGQEVWTPDAYGNDQPAYLVGGATISGGVLLTDDAQGALITVTGDLTDASQDWTIQGEHKRTGATVGDRVFEWSEDIDNLVQLYVDGGGRIDGWIGVGGVFTTINGSAVAPVGSFIDWALSYDHSTTTLRLMVGGAAVVTSVVDLSALTSMQFMSIGYGQSDPKGSSQAGEAKNVRVLLGQVATSQPATSTPLPLAPQAADENNFQWNCSVARTLVDISADEDADLWTYTTEQTNDTDFLVADSDAGGVGDAADPDPLDSLVESAWADAWYTLEADAQVYTARLTDDTSPALRGEHTNTAIGQGVNTAANTTRNADALTFPDIGLQYQVEWSASASSNMLVTSPPGATTAGVLHTTMMMHARRTSTVSDLEIWSSRTTVPSSTRARIVHAHNQFELLDGSTSRDTLSWANVDDQAVCLATVFDGTWLAAFVTEVGQRFGSIGTMGGNVDAAEFTDQPAYRHADGAVTGVPTRLWGFAVSARQMQVTELVDSYELATGTATDIFADTSGNGRHAYVVGDVTVSGTPAADIGARGLVVVPYHADIYASARTIDLHYTPDLTTSTNARELTWQMDRGFPNGFVNLRVLPGGAINLDVRDGGVWKTLVFDATVTTATEIALAIEWSGGTVRAYADGVLQTNALAVTSTDPGLDFIVGGTPNGRQCEGEIRALRISSVARYGGVGYSPTTSYTTDANTVGIWPMTAITT